MDTPGGGEERPGAEAAKGRGGQDCSVPYAHDSSPESEDVLSEEDVTHNMDPKHKRALLRKTKSWKTFFNVVHWTFRRSNSWVQLAGHEGHFRPGVEGVILKRNVGEESECLQELMGDVLRPFVPTYHGLVQIDGLHYIQMDDLLAGWNGPCIMDCKMGLRTYVESELSAKGQRATLRGDLYQKMVRVDPGGPSEEERRLGGVTKARYMQWRETLSSSASLAFRIEGITMNNGTVMKDFKKTKTREQITATLSRFTEGNVDVQRRYLERLQAIEEALLSSKFFRTHEVIGSSLLFIHERSGGANVWMIDFGKTQALPAGQTLAHDRPWVEGNREDGYLLGLANLRQILADTLDQQCCPPATTTVTRPGVAPTTTTATTRPGVAPATTTTTTRPGVAPTTTRPGVAPTTTRPGVAPTTATTRPGVAPTTTAAVTTRPSVAPATAN